MLVIFEEAAAKPDGIEILTVNRDTICSFITEYHPPNIKSWQSKNQKLVPTVENAKAGAVLNCPGHKKITAVEFASFGNPTGPCGQFELGNCTVPATKQIVEEKCLGKESCFVPMDRAVFLKNGDACPGVIKALAIQVKCSA